MQPEVMPHLIVVQASPVEHIVAVISTVISSAHPGFFVHIAKFLTNRPGKADIIQAAEGADPCYPAISELQCMIWHGQQELRSVSWWFKMSAS